MVAKRRRSSDRYRTDLSATKDYPICVMTHVNEPPKSIGEIIDQVERIREDLFILQGSLEKIESIERALSDTDNKSSK